MILKVGLTGGIASGKSTVARTFEGLGAVVVDADQIVRNLYRPGEAGYKAIVGHYGRRILSPSGDIDRAALSNIALATAESANELNRLIHPLVIEREHRLFEELEHSAADAIAIVEATLLLESGGRQRYDKIVVVDIDPDIQLARAVGRRMEREEVLRRMGRQMPREERLRFADYVIENNGDIVNAEKQTRTVYEQLRADLAARKKKAD